VATKGNTPAISGPLGGLPGSGRTPKALQFKNYPKAIALLDEAIEPAIKVLIEGLSATTNVYDKKGELIEADVPDKWYRMNCAVQLLKKAIPDKKIKEITGAEGGPIEVNVNKREAVLGVLQILESKTLEELQREIEGDAPFSLSMKKEEKDSQ
jgi:hypothetical protein